MKAFEKIEHTADTGLRIYGRTHEELFAHAAQGLAELITDPQALDFTSGFQAAESRFELKAENLQALLAAWLRELVFRFSARNLIYRSFRFERLTEIELAAAGEYSRFDPSKHEQRYEVKAVTYHGFALRQTAEGWVAEVIFDI